MYHVPLVFNVYMNGVMKEMKIGMGIKWRLPGLLYAGDLVLCVESEEDKRAMVGRYGCVGKEV